MTARLKNMMTVSGHDLDFPRSTFDSSLRMLFNNGGQWSIGTELLSLSVSRYLHPNISVPRPWPFRVTWRHRSRVHLIPKVPFSLTCAIVHEYVSPATFEMMGPNILRPWHLPFKITWHHRSHNRSICHLTYGQWYRTFYL